MQIWWVSTIKYQYKISRLNTVQAVLSGHTCSAACLKGPDRRLAEWFKLSQVGICLKHSQIFSSKTGFYFIKKQSRSNDSFVRPRETDLNVR